MSTKKVFEAPKFQEFTIHSNGAVYGHIRIKPSGVAWKPKGAHSKWHMLSIDQFADLAMKQGKQQKK